VTTVEELTDRFAAQFQDKGEVVAIDAKARAVIAVAYDTFELGFALDPEHGSFGIAVRVGPHLSQTVFLGQPPLLDNSDEAVREMFRRAHHWCALHLPEAIR
jgi:hypothetical protein